MFIPTNEVTMPMLNRSVHPDWESVRVQSVNGVECYVVEVETVQLERVRIFDNYEWFSKDEMLEELDA